MMRSLHARGFPENYERITAIRSEPMFAAIGYHEQRTTRPIHLVRV
jgi:hypothetical protein